MSIIKKTQIKVKFAQIKNVKLIVGGKNRQQSAFNALKYLTKNKVATKVLIHDVARPNFSLKLFNSIITNMKNSRAVIPKIKVQRCYQTNNRFKFK